MCSTPSWKRLKESRKVEVYRNLIGKDGGFWLLSTIYLTTMDNTNLNNEAIHQPGLITKLKAATEKVNKLGGRVAIEQLPHHA
jgi:hypothetical protein